MPRKAQASRMPSFQGAKAKVTRAINTVRAGILELEREAGIAARHATRKERAEIERYVKRQVIKLEQQERKLLEQRLRLDELEREWKRRKEAPKEPKLIGERELLIRGYWDRYPTSDQRRYPNSYKHIPKSWREGPTAYDLLAEDLDSFTPEQRKYLQARVAYGINPQTGTILPASDKMLDKMGLIIYPSLNREEAIDGITRLLVRAGFIDTPRGFGKKRKAKVKKRGAVTVVEHVQPDPIPVGIQWWIVPS